MKRSYLLKTFLRTRILVIQLSPLPIFPSRTNLKLHNNHLTPKLFKKVITNLDSPSLSGPDCIPVLVLKKCHTELSPILAELVLEGILFSRVLVGLVCGSCI